MRKFAVEALALGGECRAPNILQGCRPASDDALVSLMQARHWRELNAGSPSTSTVGASGITNAMAANIS